MSEGSQYLSLKFPLSFGYGYYPDESHDAKNIVYAGVMLNYFPTAQGIFKYYLGPEIRGGYAEYESSRYIYYLYTYNHQKIQFFYGKALLNNGVIFSPTNHFNISSNIAFGVQYFERTRIGLSPTFSFNVSFGYRF